MVTPKHNHFDSGQTRFEPGDVNDDAIKAFISAANVLWRKGDYAAAELRLRQALRQAELAFGENSDPAKSVLCIIIGLYRAQRREAEAVALERQLLIPVPQLQSQLAPQEPTSLQSRFLRKKHASSDQMNRVFHPPEIRKACQVLGLPLDQEFSIETVLKAWKKKVVEGSFHPDLGGEQESSVIVNTSKDIVIRWLESRLPRLGKHFETSRHI